MKKLIWGFTLALLLGANASAQMPSSSGMTSLFDGRSLDNWTLDDSQYASHFSVQDGLLHIEGEGGWLRSTRQYSDFTLRVEFRYLTEDPTTGPGNGRVGTSGIFLRTPAEATYGTGWPDNSLEVQLANRQGYRPAHPGDARWGGTVLRHGNPGGFTTYNTGTAITSHSLGQTGEWQTLEIQVVGDAIHVTLNDYYLGTGSAGGNATGYIGIQAESGAIEFRSIEINEDFKGLVDSRSEDYAPLFDGETLDGWHLANPGTGGYEVVNGTIEVRGRPSVGERTDHHCQGNIYTDETYGDFTVRYQARFETNGSVGGFYIREPLDGGYNQVETRAMEEKLLPWNGIFMRGGEVQQGDTVFDYHAALLAYAATEDWTRDWVHYKVQAQGSRVTTWVNGVLLSKGDNVAPLEGSIGLQCESETKWFRNIEIRENYP